MSKTTKYFDLFSAIRAGGDKGASPEALCEALGFTEGMLAVYIHALRNKFGAVIESVRNGRKVTSYRITNIDECSISITPHRKPRVSKQMAAKGITTKAVGASKVARVTKTVKTKTASKKRKLDKDNDMVPVLEDMSITEYDSDDLDDIKEMLGI